MATSAGLVGQELPHSVLLEQVWQFCVDTLARGVKDVILPGDMQELLGQTGIRTLKERFSTLIQGPAVVFYDQSIDVIRMVRPLELSETVQRKERAGTGVRGFLSGESSSRATRPLNSWIAFRCFYSPLFGNVAQKEISGFLTRLWQRDPFKSKWTILARAYSIIRDARGKKAAPLDHFLVISAPYVGIIPPSNYLALLGWVISSQADGQRVLIQNFPPNLSGFDVAVVGSDHSVRDVLLHCLDKGYIPKGCEELRLVDGTSPTEDIMTVRAAAPSIFDLQTGIDAPTGQVSSAALDRDARSLVQEQMKGLASSPAAPNHEQKVVSASNDSSPAVNSQTGDLPIDTLQALFQDPAGPFQPTRPVTTPQLGAAQRTIDFDRCPSEDKPASHNEPETTKECPKYPESIKEKIAEYSAKQAAVHRQKYEDFLALPGASATQNFANVATEFPHLAHFAYDVERFDVRFDPFEGDAFDTYEMSDYINWDL